MTSDMPPTFEVTPVSRNPFAVLPAGTPGRAVVYATAAGQTAYFGGQPLRRRQLLFSAYRTRYDVDISDHHRRAELRETPLPARGDIYHFAATVHVGFRVHDPVQVVRRNIVDPLPVVYGHLLERLRSITRAFEIEQSEAAETAIRNAFPHGMVLPEGITIFALSPHLAPDADAIRYQQDLVHTGRMIKTDAVDHARTVQQSVNQGVLDEMAQAARIETARRQRAALGDRELSLDELVRQHLTHYPQDTQTMIQLLTQHERAMFERQDVHNQRSMELFQYLIDKGLLLSSELEPMLAKMMGGGLPGSPLSASVDAAPKPPLTAGGATGPAGPPAPSAAPAAPAAAAAGGSAATDKPPAVLLEQHPGTGVWQPIHGVQPVYVMVDESSSAGPYITDLSAGVRSLHDALLKAPDVVPAIRLAVLGYADGVATRLPLDMVAAGGQPPWLTARGPARYASAFEALLASIPFDIEALKQKQPVVRRPVVFLLSAGAPSDGGAWRSPYRRLTDHRYAPNVVACGIADAPPELIAAIATQPQYGTVMASGTDVRVAIEQYWQSLARNILGSGRALINGEAELMVDPPAGFRIASEVI